MEPRNVALTIYGDGDCLFSSASVALSGADCYRNLLRMATFYELQENKKYYTKKIKEENLFSFVWSDVEGQIIPENPLEDDIKNQFDVEATRGVRPKAFSGFLQMWGLATVLERDIVSLYPGDQSTFLVEN